MSDILDALGWLFDRSQQGLFQGSKAYADNTARNYQYLNKDVGLTPALSGSLAGTASLAPAAWAAVQGLSGGGRRVDGTELSEGFTENPRIDNAIGQGLNVTADPATPFTAWSKFGAAGKTLNDLAGTAKRTWGSIRGAMANQPQTIAKMDERLGNVLAKYGLDIPVAPKTAVDPVMVRTSDPAGVLKKRMGYKSPGGSVNEGATGFSPMDNNMIAYYQGTQERTLPHELTHWATKTLPEGLKDAANYVLGGFENRFPGYVGSLRKNASYKHATPAQAGEELFARDAERVLQQPDYQNNVVLQEILKRAQAQIRPEMFRDATPLGVSNVPTGINILEALQDYFAGGEETRR